MVKHEPELYNPALKIAAVLCCCTRSSKAPIQNLNMRLTRHSTGRGDRI